MMNRPPRLRCPLLSAIVLLLALAGPSARAVAQENAQDWTTAVNLSQSGVASSPAIVLVPDGTQRVLWWDQFDGTMVVDGVLSAPSSEETEGSESEGEPEAPASADASWSSPRMATIRLPRTVTRQGQQVVVLAPIEAVPRIVGDASGRAHAFWLGEPDEETGDIPLLYSRLGPGSTSWSSPASLVRTAGSFDVTSDSTGRVHLVYVQTEPVQNLPVGLYYRQLDPGGAGWRSPTVVQESSYVRLLAPEGDDLRLTADDAGNLYAAWNDPNQGQVLLAHSADGGATWSEPEPYVGSGVQPEQDRVIALPGSASAVLWAPVSDAGRRIVAGAAGNTLQLAAWDGVRWSETAEQPLRLEDPESGEQVRLHDLSLMLVPPSADEGGSETLAVIGLDDNHDLWIAGARVNALEQLLVRPASVDESSGAGVPAPVNLSQSGTASDPAIVASGGDRLYAFWEDQFDGLTVADALVVASTVLSGTEEIPVSRELWSEPRAQPLLLPETEEGAGGAAAHTPVEGVPQMVADANGGIHAFWVIEPAEGGQAGEEAAARPLMHSQLTPDGTAWLSHATLAEAAAAFDIAADSAGALHLAYIEMGHTAASPAGVYYRRLEPGSAHWTAPLALEPSRYFRLLTPETAHVRLTADEAGPVYVTWDDPRLERSLLAHSPDGGATWQAPVTVGEPEGQSQRARLVTPPGGEALILWETGQAASTCNLHQAPASAVLGGSAGGGQQVLEGLVTCPEDEQFLPLGEGQVLMVLGSGTDALTLAVWGGAQWSEPSRVTYSFEDPELGRQVYLGNLRAALVGLSAPSPEGGSGQALVAVGTDQQGDVWATSSEMGALEVVFAPPPPWSAPVSLSGDDLYPGLPAAAVDAEGWLHVLWSEAPSAGEPGTALFYARWDGTQWTRPASVLSSGEGKADQPALVAVGDRLHAVWSGGQSGEVLYSHAFASDAYAAGGWSEPVPLPAPGEVGSAPDITAGTDGSLHVVFAVPLNEGRGIYYTRSSDGGQTWSAARQVFDAAAAGWLMADGPRVAVDAQGLLHVAWVRGGLPGSGMSGSNPPQGVYYAGSFDGGETWSEAFEAAAGTYAWPEVVSGGTGQVHLVWNETGTQPAWWHCWSLDAGQTWTRPERVSGFGEASAPAALLDEGSGALVLLGLGNDSDGDPALWLSTWDGQRWGAPEASGLEVGAIEAGLVASLQPAQGRLEALFRAEGESEEGTVQVQLWHTGRQLPTVAVTPMPAVAPLLTATPVPTPEPTVTPRPTASFGLAPPATGESSLPIPVLAAGGLAALIVAGALAGRFLWARRR